LRARLPRAARLNGAPAAAAGAATIPGGRSARSGCRSDVRMVRNIAAYRFVEVADPPAVAARVRAWAEEGGLRGTVLVAPEGINLFLAGADVAVDEIGRASCRARVGRAGVA